MAQRWLAGDSVFVGGRALAGWGLRLEGDRLAEVGPLPADLAVLLRAAHQARSFTLPDGGSLEAWPNHQLAPALFDSHIHGGLEHDVADASPEAFAGIAGHLATRGVGAWLATTVACSAEALAATLGATRQAMQQPPPGARCVGAHLESNFLSPRFKGAQPAEQLRGTEAEDILAVVEAHREVVKLLTLAPELPGAEALIRRLVGWGIRVSVGHTDATHEQVVAAVAAGATRMTHLCNAMRGLHHREPGALGAGLVLDGLACELIADGVHVHPAVAEVACRCKPMGQLILVSDAVRGTGLAPGRYELGGQTTVLDGSISRLEDGTIAGSVLGLDQAARNLAHWRGRPLAEAWAMASEAPAASLGLAAELGVLRAGARADVVAIGPAQEVAATWVGGVLAHGGLA